MKFDNKKISNYLIFLIYLVNVLICFLFSIFIKRKKRIILFGHKLEGNIYYFLQMHSEFNYKVFYVSFIYKEYKVLKTKYTNVLYALNIFHVFKIIESSILITSHGILFHKFLKKFKGMKTFNIGHGITNVLNTKKPKEQDPIFDSHWVMSNFEKTVIENDLKRKILNLEPTGFLRVDNLVSNRHKKEEIKNQLNLKGKIGLYAPSGVEIYDKDNDNNFQYQNLEFLRILNKECKKNKITLIFKPHYFNYSYREIEKDVISYIENSTNLVYFKKFEDISMNEMMICSDFLITDYSSLFVDYLVLKKPIIFLNVIKRREVYKYSQYLNNEYINFIDTFKEFEGSFKNLIFESLNLQKLEEFEKIIFNDIYHVNVLERYKQSICKTANIKLNEI